MSFTWNEYFNNITYIELSKILRTPEDYGIENTQKYFKWLNNLPW
jgi:hypothetical protein